MTCKPMPVHHSIADILIKLLCKFQVNLSNSSRVIAFFVPAPSSHNCYQIHVNIMSTLPGSASGSGLLLRLQLMCPYPPLIGMHQIKYENFNCSSINSHPGRRSTRSCQMRWTTFSLSLARKGMLPWIAGCPLILQTKMMLENSLTTSKVPLMMRYIPMLESISWKMLRRGQIRQLMHSLIVYTNLLTMH